MAANPAKARAGVDRYNKTLKGAANARKQRGTRRARLANAVVGALRGQDVQAMLAVAKKCPDCGRPYTKKRIRTIDHALALKAGGEHTITNLRVVCMSCNSSKGARPFASNGQGLLI